MPTNILRKLDIAFERKVVAAQSRTTTPSSAPGRSNCRAGCSSARTPNRTRVTLNGFMACSSLAGARASTRPSINVEHYVLALTLVFRPELPRLPGPKADARADGAPKKAQEEHHTFRFLAMMPRAITGESQPLKNLVTVLRSVPSRECGGEDATPLGA